MGTWVVALYSHKNVVNCFEIFLPATGVVAMESMAVLTVEGALFFAFVRVIEISAVNTSEKQNYKNTYITFFLLQHILSILYI